jgi:hypothetical protein
MRWQKRCVVSGELKVAESIHTCDVDRTVAGTALRWVLTGRRTGSVLRPDRASPASGEVSNGPA